ncbi:MULTISPECIES: hypothetical protein [Eikenella]|uniref:Uncharacterized protein n=1 Tax=Eikenella longinqua TaxID=1795827 RepID=A0A1A9RYZ0_9NEIS|nr:MULTISPECIES: hypothetical protein [Eikenella]OAM29202.1 hypothetical protein A7P95_04450 [Eikenella longinqua]
MQNILNINTRPIELQRQGQTIRLPFALADIAARLTPFPPSEAAWENAIMQIEDAIAPLPKRLAGETLRLQGAHALAALPHSTGGTLSTDTLETAFAILAGYCHARDLPPLPHSADFAAQVLLMREWAHHLGFAEILIGQAS